MSLRDVGAVMWKESREMARQRSTLVSSMLLLVIFGVALPAQRGARFLGSPSSLYNFGMLPFVVIVAFIADAFAGERERKTLESLLATRLTDGAILAGKLLTAVSYAWALVWGEAILAFVAVGVATGRFEPYDPTVLVGGLALGLAVAVFMASLGVLVSLRAATVKQAQQVLALVVAGAFALALVGVAALPDAWQKPLLDFVATAGVPRLVAAAVLALAIVDAALVALCVARFRRARLILD